MRARRTFLLGVLLLAAGVGAVVWWMRDDVHPGASAAASSDATSTESAPSAADAAGGRGIEPTVTDDAARIEADGFAPNAEWFAPADPLVLRGRVVAEATGEPIANAAVGAFERVDPRLADLELPRPRDRSRLPQGVALTDADGRYELTLADVPSDEFKLEAHARGFGGREQSIGEFLGTELTVDFELLAERRASGRIVDADGRPVGSAVVSAHASIFGTEGMMTDFRETKSGADGAFLLTELRPDLTHVLQIQKPGFARLVYAFLADEKAFEQVEFGEIGLARETRLQVAAVDDAGAPLAGVSLFLEGGNADWMRFAVSEPAYNRRDLWHRRGVTDASGRFEFTELGAGSWTLSASLRGRPNVPSIDLQITGSEPLQKATFTFPRGLSISGRVLDESGRPFGAANVFVRWDAVQPYLFLVIVADESGRFVARGLEPGTFRVFTRNGSWMSMADPTVPRADDTLVAAGTEDVELRCERLAHDTIRGVVRYAGGQPVAFATVKAFLEGGGDLQTRTRVGGRFAITIPHGGSVKLLAGPTDLWPPTLGEKPDLSGLVTASASSGEVVLTYVESR